MRHAPYRPPSFRLSLFCALLALTLVGCSSPRIDWSQKIGELTHDEAILELGPPLHSATLTDGTIVSEFLLARGSTYTHFHTDPGPPFWRPGFFWPGPVYATETSTPDRFVRLTFGPDKKLKNWKYVAK